MDKKKAITTDRQEELVKQFIDAAITVHRELGPGYDEAIYENALAIEMDIRGIPYERQKVFDVTFKGHVVGEGRMDFVLGSEVVVELKTVDKLSPKHTAQTIKYLKALGKPLGLLVNFHEYLLKDGLKRIIYAGN
ncbi:hypothetical protein PDESU_06123 [Pontiella desulfatans]|uniref:GxxExxY protein n=1 Tax=Pontiella desulfatans TaxID=2750659 RepID=A0A6C2UE86_PONDE|nr:GxxExxY protein [Pontiella desulfatans]VGO17526.1 hypothetical protein PDESU_06123 [Pontiella desulfatans]